jgi:bacteriocin-like protein
MELFERILIKKVGAEMSKEELEAVSGGQIDYCTQQGGWWAGGADSPLHCDFSPND